MDGNGRICDRERKAWGRTTIKVIAMASIYSPREIVSLVPCKTDQWYRTSSRIDDSHCPAIPLLWVEPYPGERYLFVDPYCNPPAAIVPADSGNASFPMRHGGGALSSAHRRKRKIECCTLVDFCLGPDLSVQPIQDPLDEGKTDPRAIALFTMETLKTLNNLS